MRWKCLFGPISRGRVAGAKVVVGRGDVRFGFVVREEARLRGCHVGFGRLHRAEQFWKGRCAGDRMKA